MMKKALAFIVLLGFIAVSNSQTADYSPTITWSDDAKMKPSLQFQKFLPVGYDQTGVYAILFPRPQAINEIVIIKRKIKLAHITPDLTMERVVELNLKEGDVEKDYEFALWLNNELYIFSSFQNQRLKRTFLFAQTVDKKTLEVNDDVMKIAEIDYNDFNKFKYAEFDYKLSPDSTKLLITYALLDKNNTILDKGLSVFSNNFTTLWHSRDLGPQDSSVFRFDEFAINNNGDVYILGKSFESRKELDNHQKYKRVVKFYFYGDYLRLRELPWYEYRVVALTYSGTRKQVFTPSVPNRFVRNLTLTAIGGDKILCAGVFSNEKSYSVLGNCSFIIDVHNNRMTHSLHNFSSDFITEGLNKKKQVRKYEKGKEFDNYYYFPKPLIEREDGGFYMLTEQVERRRESIRSENTTITFNSWMYDDIIIASLSEKGETEWVRRIDKNMYAAFDGVFYSSFRAYPRNDELFLVFTEFNKKATNMFGVIKRSESTFARIDRHGNVYREVISTAKDDGVALQPGDAGQLCPNSLFMMGYNSFLTFKFLKLELPVMETK
jgi:hypothetical protein